MPKAETNFGKPEKEIIEREVAKTTFPSYEELRWRKQIGTKTPFYKVHNGQRTYPSGYINE